MKGKIESVFREDWKMFQMALDQFVYSLNACKIFGEEHVANESEQEKMEAFTARFARLLDIYTQKILKGIDIVEGYGDGSLRDILNRCEKSGIIASASTVLQWRILRNEIAHDYIPTEQRRIFHETMKVAESFLHSISTTKVFLESTGLSLS